LKLKKAPLNFNYRNWENFTARKRKTWILGYHDNAKNSGRCLSKRSWRKLDVSHLLISQKPYGNGIFRKKVDCRPRTACICEGTLELFSAMPKYWLACCQKMKIVEMCWTTTIVGVRPFIETRISTITAAPIWRSSTKIRDGAWTVNTVTLTQFQKSRTRTWPSGENTAAP